MPYDYDNPFARILRGEIPCSKVYEDEFALAFNDIHPKAPVHILVVPKGTYEDHADFSTRATEKEITGFARAVTRAAIAAGIAHTGYRLITNCGDDSGQEVPHYHVHILGGHALGPLVVTQ